MKIIMHELDDVEERCPGYKDDLSHLLGDILLLEREHTIGRINIVQKIADKINTLGMDLYKSRISQKSE